MILKKLRACRRRWRTRFPAFFDFCRRMWPILAMVSFTVVAGALVLVVELLPPRAEVWAGARAFGQSLPYWMPTWTVDLPPRWFSTRVAGKTVTFDSRSLQESASNVLMRLESVSHIFPTFSRYPFPPPSCASDNRRNVCNIDGACNACGCPNEGLIEGAIDDELLAGMEADRTAQVPRAALLFHRRHFKPHLWHQATFPKDKSGAVAIMTEALYVSEDLIASEYAKQIKPANIPHPAWNVSFIRSRFRPNLGMIKATIPGRRAEFERLYAYFYLLTRTLCRAKDISVGVDGIEAVTIFRKHMAAVRVNCDMCEEDEGNRTRFFSTEWDPTRMKALREVSECVVCDRCRLDTSVHLAALEVAMQLEADAEHPVSGTALAAVLHASVEAAHAMLALRWTKRRVEGVRRLWIVGSVAAMCCLSLFHRARGAVKTAEPDIINSEELPSPVEVTNSSKRRDPKDRKKMTGKKNP